MGGVVIAFELDELLVSRMREQKLDVIATHLGDRREGWLPRLAHRVGSADPIFALVADVAPAEVLRDARALLRVVHPAGHLVIARTSTRVPTPIELRRLASTSSVATGVVLCPASGHELAACVGSWVSEPAAAKWTGSLSAAMTLFFDDLMARADRDERPWPGYDVRRFTHAMLRAVLSVAGAGEAVRVATPAPSPVVAAAALLACELGFRASAFPWRVPRRSDWPRLVSAANRLGTMPVELLLGVRDASALTTAKSHAVFVPWLPAHR